MTEFIKVATLNELPSGQRLVIDYDGQDVGLINLNDEIYAVSDVCTHDDGPLEDGELQEYEVECPRHGARFDIRSGAALCLPATSPVPIYKVKVEGDIIYVENPDEY